MADPHHRSGGTVEWDPIDSYEKLLYLELGASAVGVLLGAATHGYFLAGCSMFAGAGGMLLLRNQHEVPTNPRHVGVMTWWGKRSTARLLPSGTYFIWKSWPFQTNITNISLEPRVKDFSIHSPTVLKDTTPGAAKTAPRAGGNVEVNVQLVFVPNTNSPSEMFQYIDNGGPATSEPNPSGVLINNLQGKIAEIVRTTVSRLSWNEAQFKKSELTALLMSRITGRKIPKYSRGADLAGLRADGSVATSRPEYHQIGFWTEKEMMEGCAESEKLALDVYLYMDDINDPANDIADVHGLGIIIKRLNVEEVKLLGKLAEDAEGAAREQAQKETRRVEMEGRMELAAKMAAKSKENGDDPALTVEAAMMILRIEDDKSHETINRFMIGGIDSAALAAMAPAILGFMRHVSSGPQNNTGKGKKK